MSMDAEIVVAIVAAAISLALELVPGLNSLWDKLSPQGKSLATFVLSIVLPVAFVGAACLGLDFGVGAACPNPAEGQMWLDAVLLGLTAYLSSQATFKYVSAPLGARLNAVQHGVG